MSMIRLIHHVNVQVSDRARTREWYQNVLGAEFLDRGPALNRRQLQLRLGGSEIHFTETPHPASIPSSHFAVEVDNWEAMLSHLETLGIPHGRRATTLMRDIGGTDPRQGRREDTGEHFTYVHDPDGNMIELVYHPLGIENRQGTRVEVMPDAQGLRWTQLPGFVASAQGGS
jgi:catechol 2,3-dioxygenase-like lactoylglutathione lyase family enzyme